MKLRELYLDKVKKGNVKNKLIFFIFSVWAAAVLFFFNKALPVKFFRILDYLSSLPGSFELKGFFSYLSSSAIDIFLAVFLLAAAYIIGRRIAAPLKKGLDTPGFFAVSTGAGFAVIAGFIFLLASCGLLFETVIYTVFIVFFVYTLFELKRKPAGLRFQYAKYTAAEKIILLLLCLAALLNLFCALTPETFFDSLLYHLAVPQAYIFSHSFTKLPYNIFAAFPQNGELLYLAGLVLNGPVTAKLINYLFGILLTAAVYSFGKKYTGRTAGLFAALLFYSMPVVSANLVNTQVDCLLTFYIFLSFYMLLEACEKSFGRAALAFSGLFAGFAMGIKYSGIIFVPGLVLLLLWYLLRKKTVKDAGQLFSIFFIFCLVPIVPWLIKNYIFWGNPVYPYFSGHPGLARLFFEQTGPALAGLRGFLLLPWTLTMSAPFASMNIGPAFLLFFPFLFWLLIFKRKEKIAFSALIIVFTAALIFWLPVTRIARFFLPGLLFFALLLACAVIKFLKDAKDDYFSFSVALAAAVLTLNNIAWVADLHFKNMDPLSYASGKVSKEGYLAKGRPTYPDPYFGALKYINKLPGSSGKILFIGENRPFYCTKPFIWGSVFDKAPLLEFAARSRNEAGLRQVLKEEGISYALVNYGELARNKKMYELSSTLDFIKSREFTVAFTPVFESGTCCVFRVNQP